MELNIEDVGDAHILKIDVRKMNKSRKGVGGAASRRVYIRCPQGVGVAPGLARGESVGRAKGEGADQVCCRGMYMMRHEGLQPLSRVVPLSCPFSAPLLRSLLL